MHAYEISRNEGARPVYAGDLRSVKTAIAMVNRDARDYMRIHLVDVPSHKEEVLRLLNGQAPHKTVLKRWRVGGPRGGKLIEITGEEE